MTLSEIKGFLLTIGRNEILESIKLLSGNTTSHHDPKSVKKIVDSYKKDLKKLDKNMQSLFES